MFGGEAKKIILTPLGTWTRNVSVKKAGGGLSRNRSPSLPNESSSVVKEKS